MDKSAVNAVILAVLIFVVLLLQKGMEIRTPPCNAPTRFTDRLRFAGSASGVLIPLERAYSFKRGDTAKAVSPGGEVSPAHDSRSSSSVAGKGEDFFAGSSLPPGASAAVFAGQDGPRVRIAAAGDVMLHQRCHRSVRQRSKGSFNNSGYDGLFTGMPRAFLDSDLAVANLEFPVYKQRKIERPLVFHGELPVLYALRRAGFRILNAANNHSYDHGRQSPASTSRLCRKAGVACPGVGPERATARKPHMETINGVKLAFIGYSLLYNVNYNSGDPDKPHVNGYDFAGLVEEVRGAAREADGVVVNLHWGAEYRTYPLRWQYGQARRLVDAGACLILGHHPHVPGRIQLLESDDGRKALVAYSLSNLVSNQSRGRPYGLTRLGLILKTDLVKTERGVEVKAWESLPTWVYNHNTKKDGELIEDIHVEVVPLRIKELEALLAREKDRKEPDRKRVRELEKRIRFYKSRSRKTAEILREPSGKTESQIETSGLFLPAKAL
ncbi:MAG: CapA family protein [bacterium]